MKIGLVLAGVIVISYTYIKLRLIGGSRREGFL